MQSHRCLPTFQRWLLLPSSGRLVVLFSRISSSHRVVPERFTERSLFVLTGNKKLAACVHTKTRDTGRQSEQHRVTNHKANNIYGERRALKGSAKGKKVEGMRSAAGLIVRVCQNCMRCLATVSIVSNSKLK